MPVYTKGYLVEDDLAWDVQEFLQGSEQVNDVCRAAHGTKTWMCYATNADLVFVLLKNTAVGGTTPILNTLGGYATLPGGFSLCTAVGSYVYAVSRVDPNEIYRFDCSTLSGGDDTPGAWAALITESAGYEITGLRGDTISTVPYLYYCGGDLATHSIAIHNLDTSTTYTTTLGDTANTNGGKMPKGDFAGALYWFRGNQIYVKYSPEAVAANDWAFDVSYGYAPDAFASAEDLNRWMWAMDGNMTDCYTQSGGGTLAFAGQVSAPGESSAAAYRLCFMAGAIGVKAAFNVSAWPAAGPGTQARVALTLADQTGNFEIRAIRVRDDVSDTFQYEFYVGGVIVDSGSVPFNDDIFWLAVAREQTYTGAEYSAGFSSDGTIFTMFQYEDTPGGNLGALFPQILIRNDTGNNGPDGTVDYLSTHGTNPDAYTDPPDSDIVGAGISPSLAGDIRHIALAFDDLELWDIQADETDAGGMSNGTTYATQYTHSEPLTSFTSAAMNSDGTRAVFGGDPGVLLFLAPTNGMFSQVDPMLRYFTTDYDHAQPLTWTEVLAVEYSPANVGEGFGYGTMVNPGGHSGSGVGSGEDPPSSLTGGGGFIIPDFSAPTGSDAWAEARHGVNTEIRAGGNHSTASDYMHAHFERRITGGSWYRLKSTGWTVIAAPWDDSTDVVFAPDATLDAMQLCIQDEGLTTDGRYEYRIVYHDEAGNQGYVYCSTLYSNYREYLDTPVITAITINGGAGTTTDRGVNVNVSGHSGTSSGSIANAVYQVKIYNSGEEAASAWRDYTSGADYLHRLTAGGGVKTVYAKIRHVSGDESAAQSASITYSPGTVVSTRSYAENILLAYGNETLNVTTPYNFTGDLSGRVTASSEDSEYPAENVQAYDVLMPWKSNGLGILTVDSPSAGFNRYTAILTYDLLTAHEIKIFAVLGHNFGDMERYAAAAGGGLSVVLQRSANGSAWTTVADFGNVLTRTTLVHRPELSYRYWRLYMSIYLDTSIIVPDIYPDTWTVGRIVLNESALCWQPTINAASPYTVGRIDPSEVARAQGQARRVVEKQQYRYADLDWKLGRNPLAYADHLIAAETIYRRQGVKRPVFLIVDPANVSTGVSDPASADPEPTTIYGYLQDSQAVDWGVNDYGSISMRIDEAL